MGAVLTMPVAGALCAVSHSGWHYAFYLFGKYFSLLYQKVKSCFYYKYNI